jgi:OOP family OmpA-OmpF porin
VIVAKPPVFVVDDVNFEFDKSNLRPAATAILDRVAGELRAQPNVPYEVAGFTDSVGTAAYNQGLSERRAFAVHDYLIGRGVDDGQISARGYGESNAIVSNSTKEDRARNRRVEVRPQQ